jgi:hypothetical protein
MKLQEIEHWTEINPRPIQTEFPHQCRVLRQLKRSGNIALYQLLGGGGKMPLGYEVVRIRIAPPVEIEGRAYPWREYYPKSTKHSDDWGRHGFSYGRDQRERAEERYQDMVCEGDGVGTVSSLDSGAGRG